MIKHRILTIHVFLNEYIYIYIMNATIEIKKILAQVDQMDEQAKANVLEKIKAILSNAKIAEENSKLTLYSLKGVGSDLWRDTDVEEYIKKEREW